MTQRIKLGHIEDEVMRDLFALAVLVKIAMFDTTSYPAQQARQAKAAYDYADAMMEERSKRWRGRRDESTTSASFREYP